MTEGQAARAAGHQQHRSRLQRRCRCCAACPVQPAGGIVALLAATAWAGKSTTPGRVGTAGPGGRRALVAGRIAFDGGDTAGARPQNLVRAGLAHVMEGRRVFEGPERRGKPGGRHLRADRAARRRRTSTWCTATFPGCMNGARAWPATCPAASSRCWLSAGADRAAQAQLLLTNRRGPVAHAGREHLFHHRAHQPRAGRPCCGEQNASVALAVAHHGYIMETGCARRTLASGSPAAGRNTGRLPRRPGCARWPAGGRIVSENLEWLLTQMGAGAVGAVAGRVRHQPAGNGLCAEHADIELVVRDQEQVDKVCGGRPLPGLRRIVVIETGACVHAVAERARIVTLRRSRKTASDARISNRERWMALDGQRLADIGLMITPRARPARRDATATCAAAYRRAAGDGRAACTICRCATWPSRCCPPSCRSTWVRR